jgi:hypothetical protein
MATCRGCTDGDVNVEECPDRSDAVPSTACTRSERESKRLLSAGRSPERRPMSGDCSGSTDSLRRRRGGTV